MHFRITSEVVRSAGRRIGTTVACALIALLSASPVLAQPRIMLDIDNFESNLVSGEAEDFTVNVANDGNEVLRWTIEFEELERPRGEAIRRDGAGDVVSYFIWQRARGGQFKTAIAWDRDDDLLILSNYEQNYYGVLNPSNDYRVVSEWRGANGIGAFTATWLNGVIYASDPQTNLLQKWDLEGNDLGRINLGDIVPQSVTASPELGLLFVADTEPDQGFFVVSPEGRTLAQFNDPAEFIGNGYVGNLLWVDRQPEGNLWCESQGTLYELTVDRNDWTISDLAQSFQMPAGDQHPYGLGHDANNMIVGVNWRGDYVILEDGIYERDWLTYIPTHGMLMADTDDNVTCTLSAFGLIGGDYVADLHFQSNDPAHPDLILRVTMHVTGAPDIALHWPSEAGWPDSINFNGYNPNIFVGGEYTVPLTILNQGVEDLNVESMGINAFAFSVDPNQFVVAPRDTQQVTLRFTLEEPVNAHALLTINCNDPDMDRIDIPVSAISSTPPQMAMDPQDIELDNPAQPYSMSIANNGEAPLYWCCTLDDQNRRDHPGAVLDTLWLPHNDVRSMDWDPLTSTMWAVHGTAGLVTSYRYDAESGEVSVGFNNSLTAHASAVAFLDRQIYANDSAQHALFIFGTDGTPVQTVNLNYLPIDLASSPSNHWIFALDDEAIVHILDATNNWHEIGKIGGIADQVAPYQAGQIAWSDRDVNGQLWVGCKDTVFEFGVDEYSKARLVQRIPVTNFNRFDGLGHDDENLWLAAWGRENRTVAILDDGATQSPITVSPFQGVRTSGSDQDVKLLFWPYHAAQPDGNYILHFLSNDPNDSDVTVHLLIHWLKVNDSPAQPGEFSLRPPFPNPFNSTTTIEYSLPRPGRYALDVMDINGRLVTRLAGGWKAAGKYREVWKAEGISTGVYLLRLNGAGHTVVQSMQLIK